MHHPTTDRHDQAGLLGEGDEVQRRHEAARGVDPPDQGFDPGDLAALELDHRLVVEAELLVLERALQVGLEFQALQRGVVHRGLEHLIAALALLLRHVHRDVGVAQQLLGVGHLGALGGDRDADRGPDEDLLAFQAEGRFERLHHAVGDVDGLDAVAPVLEQDRELVPTQPGGGVGGAQAFLDPFAHLAQDLVARGMAQRVVDRLEVVEVHEQHGHRLAVAVLPFDRVRDAVAEQGAVREVRDRVVEGLMRQLLLERLAFADVAGVEHDAAHVAVVQQVGPQGLHREVGPVVVAQAELDEPGVSLGLAERREEGERAHHVVGVDQVRELRAFERFRCEAEHAMRRRARVPDRRVELEHGHDVRGVLHQRGEPSLALLAQQVFGERGALQGQGHL